MTSDWRANRVGNMQPGTGSSTTRVFFNDWFGGLFLSHLFVHCWTVASLAIHLNSAFQFKNHIFLFFGSNRQGIGLECVWYTGAEVKLTVDWTNRKRITFYFLFPFLTHIFLYRQGIFLFPFSLAPVNLSVSCEQWLKVSKVSEPFTYIFFFVTAASYYHTSFENTEGGKGQKKSR